MQHQATNFSDAPAAPAAFAFNFVPAAADSNAAMPDAPNVPKARGGAREQRRKRREEKKAGGGAGKGEVNEGNVDATLTELTSALQSSML
jgi:hypothetical protein